ATLSQIPQDETIWNKISTLRPFDSPNRQLPDSIKLAIVQSIVRRQFVPREQRGSFEHVMELYLLQNHSVYKATYEESYRADEAFREIIAAYRQDCGDPLPPQLAHPLSRAFICLNTSLTCPKGNFGAIFGYAEGWQLIQFCRHAL